MRHRTALIRPTLAAVLLAAGLAANLGAGVSTAHASAATAKSAKQDAGEIASKMAAYKNSKGAYPKKLDAATLKAMGVSMNGTNKVSTYSVINGNFRYCVVASDGGWATYVKGGTPTTQSGATGKACTMAPPTGPA